MMNEEPSAALPTVLPEEHGLKDLTEEQLFDRLMTADPEWSDEDRDMVGRAYQLSRLLHKDDEHRGMPYSFHFLRNANRLTHYLHITDAHSVAAAILHDTVEDHPDKIMQYAIFGLEEPNIAIPKVTDPVLEQQVALKHIEVLFSPRTAEIVKGMTNPPAPEGQTLSAEQKLQRYLDHVEEAIHDPGVWANKLVDWGDNGLGIVHSDFDSDSDSARELHFMTKYGKVLPILEARYALPDIQAMLDPVAKANVEHMFNLARDRLLVS
ncbi:MAG: phosphohydrolase [Candidatus Saccharibacteria bacterium]|nr:phosphohydrolase [Candidatus Saccharibacteria bacterium]